MTKNDKISIKLEVCRDKTSGKLSITAHFNSNASNVIQNKDGYFWMPTIEEKNLINEAFELFPVDGGYVSSVKTPSKVEEEDDGMPIPKPLAEEDIDSDLELKKPADLPPLETQNEPNDMFEVTDEHIKNDDFEKIIDERIDEAASKKDLKKNDKKVEELVVEEPKHDEVKPDHKNSEKQDFDEDMIVEADQDAIEAALKKHTKEDDSIVEVDEQTIIDKVLSQKKKGKWSKR